MSDDCIHTWEWWHREASNPLVICQPCGEIREAPPAWIAAAGLCVTHRVRQKLSRPRLNASRELFSAGPQRSRTGVTDEVGT